MICPCKECEKKGCGSYHDECVSYLEWVKYRNKMSAMERKRKGEFQERRKVKRWYE